MSFTYPHSRHRAQLLAAAVAFIFITLLYLNQSWGQERPPPELACRHLAGADDVLVVLKTGGTESHQKLPIHFKTTLRCIPHWIVFSDLEEEIEGHRVLDVLDEIDEDTKRSVEEFRLYNKLQEWHANGTMPSTIDALLRAQAWNLDKWKFLPLLKKALETLPDAKWYFFMEADTFLVWSNLLLYLSQLDPDKSHYIGAQNWIADTEFAHGGSGFIVSNKALRMVVEEYTSHLPQYNELTRKEWAGDLILAKAMKSQGIFPTRAFPIIQGETPFTLDYTERHWCFPVVSYHHMTPDWIQTMWDYEQKWLAVEQAKTSATNSHNSLLPEPIRHRHVFTHFVQPAISLGEKPGWHNLSPDQVAERQTTLESCRSVCKDAQSCIQWLFTAPESCKIADVVRLGSRLNAEDEPTNFTSGWMTERVTAFVDNMGDCKKDWILSNTDTAV